MKISVATLFRMATVDLAENPSKKACVNCRAIDASVIETNSLAARDRKGKMRFKNIRLGEGQVADASFNFGVTAYREP